MIVYHGANGVVKSPDTVHTQKYLDFGPGFYVTIYKEQASRWAIRKSRRHGGVPTLNSFEYNKEAAKGLRVMNFEDDDDAWLEYVCACRRGEDAYKQFDIVIGNVANDDVFLTVDMYYRGLWDKEKTLSELRYYRRNNQIAFLNQEAIDAVLMYVGSEEVSP